MKYLLHPIRRKIPKEGIVLPWCRPLNCIDEDKKYIYVNKAVHSFLKTHNFSRVQMLKLIKSSPCRLRRYSALQTFQPNIEFLRSKGLSGRQTAEVICSCPTLLRINLAKQIVPAYDALKSFFQSDSNTALVIRNCPKLLLKNVDPLLVRTRNILLYGGCGVPPLPLQSEDVVRRLLTASPRIITMRQNNLKQVFERLRDEMGLDEDSKFLEALGVVTRFTRSQWEWKLRLFKRWGLSEDQVIEGFRQHPKLMSIPAEKINGVLETLLEHSVSKRFIPRVGVLMHWIFDDLIMKEDITPAMFTITDKCFVHKYVLHDAPAHLRFFTKETWESASTEKLM